MCFSIKVKELKIFLGQFADNSESRQYKINQRLKK